MAGEDWAAEDGDEYTNKDFCMPLVCSGYCNKTWVVEKALMIHVKR